MAKMKVLNWFPGGRYTKGLKSLFGKKKKRENPDFRTLRMGPKWANRLNPGDRVAVSISDKPEKPNIIGYTEVIEVSKKIFYILKEKDFINNIGAKSWGQALHDMKAVYGKEMNIYVVVSVLDLMVLDE